MLISLLYSLGRIGYSLTPWVWVNLPELVDRSTVTTDNYDSSYVCSDDDYRYPLDQALFWEGSPVDGQSA